MKSEDTRETMEQKYCFQIRVTGIVLENQRILLVCQQVDANRSWSLPGGRLEHGETIEDAMIREIAEETGIQVTLIKLLYLAEKPEHHLLHLTFLLKRVGGEIRLPSHEHDKNPISDVKFVDIHTLEHYGFSQAFQQRLLHDFPQAGTYVGKKANIGL